MKTKDTLTVGVVGLGLIGGSVARAYQADGYTVYGADIDKTTESYATLAGITVGALTEESLSECDLVFIALYPEATVSYMKQNARRVKKGAFVFDLCGVKHEICEVGFSLAAENGYTFIGGHPMAGTQFSGLKYSRSTLFRGAPMVLVPPRYDDISLLDTAKKLLSPLGFGSFSVTTATEHDRMIAFTSQLAHVVSNAYVKSPQVQNCDGFTGGSFQDMTRIAGVDEQVWTPLYAYNRENVLGELEGLIAQLSIYRDALKDCNDEKLSNALKDGRKIRETIRRKND